MSILIAQQGPGEQVSAGMLCLTVSEVDTPQSSSHLLTTTSHPEYFAGPLPSFRSQIVLVLPGIKGQTWAVFALSVHSLTSGFLYPTRVGDQYFTQQVYQLSSLTSLLLPHGSPHTALPEIHLPPRRSQATPLCLSRVCAVPASVVFSGSYSLLLFPAFPPVISIDLKLSPPPSSPS